MPREGDGVFTYVEPTDCADNDAKGIFTDTKFSLKLNFARKFLLARRKARRATTV